MSKSRRTKGRGAQVPLFITKLMEIMENSEISDIVSWTSQGESFHIKSITRFTEEVLPLYFKHCNFSSFIRQLNMYGFHKIRHSQGENVYRNDNFRANQRHLLKNINRRVKEERQERLALYEGGANRANNGSIRIKQKSLQEMCRHFMVQNQKLMEENNNLIQRMEEESREKEKRLEEFLIMMLSQKKGLNPSEGPLSITNEAYQEGNGETPLDILSHRLEENNQYQHVRRMIDSIYGKSNKRNKDRNYTIVEPQPEHSQPQMTNNYFAESPHPHPSDPHLLDKDADSFISINDFLNADEYDNINLQESR